MKKVIIDLYFYYSNEGVQIFLQNTEMKQIIMLLKVDVRNDF